MFYYSWYDFIFNYTLFPPATFGSDHKKSYSIRIDNDEVLIFLSTTGYLDITINQDNCIMNQCQVTNFEKINKDTIMYTRLKKNYILQITKDEDGLIKCFFVGPYPSDTFICNNYEDIFRTKKLQDYCVVTNNNFPRKN